MCRGIELNDENLIKWLRELDVRLYNEKLSKYEDCPEPSFAENCNSALLIDEEYADVYRYYLMMKIYLGVGDYDRYNTFAQLYAAELERFSCAYASTHIHKRTDIKY